MPRDRKIRELQLFRIFNIKILTNQKYRLKDVDLLAFWNSAARFSVKETRSCDFCLLVRFHCLPVQERIEFKIFSNNFKLNPFREKAT